MQVAWLAVVLCDLDSRTHEQAARHLGCAVGTVKSRLARGRRVLFWTYLEPSDLNRHPGVMEPQSIKLVS